MADRVAYFKTFKLGDFLNGPETYSYDAEFSESAKSGWAKAAGVTERGPSAAFVIDVVGTYNRAHSGSETVRAFSGRILDALEEFRDAMSFGTTYTVGGSLVFIEDTAADSTTFTNSETAGSGVTVEMNSDISLDSGDYVLLRSATQYEVVQVSSPTSSDFVATLSNNWNGDDEIHRVLYYWPTAYVSQAPTFEGVAPGTRDTRQKLDWQFFSPQNSVKNL